MISLRRHPFAVEAFFESSHVLTFAVPQDQIAHLVHGCFELDTFQNSWAFVAVAMVQTRSLRPKGFPRFFGNDFFLTGYRVFVRYRNSAGRRLRGLYILKSETDKKKMEILGNLFTQYSYTTTDIDKGCQNGSFTISSEKSGFHVNIDQSDPETVALPIGSPFSDWKEARRFAGPLPFTFSFIASENKVLIIEGVREHWDPRPVKVRECRFAFIDQLNLDDVRLASAFVIDNIPYFWKKGRIETWLSNGERSRVS